MPTLCPGCFKREPFPERDECPQCGFAPGQNRSPLALPLRTELKGRYVAGRLLGAPGGFGITYLAFDKFKDERVAVKEYLPREVAGRGTDGQSVVPHSAQDQEQFEYGLDRFLKEAKTLGQFDHANIVQARDFFEANGTAYLVMTYYEGKTLKAYLEEQPEGQMDPEIATQIMLRVLDGLKEIHSEGYLHRDIKPANIYLTAEGRPILIDFGAARFALGERSRSLSVVMTEGYAPYEQYSSHGNQGPHTDVYGVGATLYRMIIGESPPPASDRVIKDTLKEPHELNSEVPERLSRVIVEALAIGDEERTSSAEALQQQLRAGLGGRKQESTSQTDTRSKQPARGTGDTQPSPTSGSSGGTVHSTAQSQPGGPQEAKTKEKTNWPVWIIWGSVVAALVFSFVSLTGRDGDDGVSSNNTREQREPVDNNVQPKARADKASTTEGEAVVIDVLSNDTDPDGDELSIEKAESVASGRVETLGDGELRYVPGDFTGATYLSYTVSDENGNTDGTQVRIQVESDGLATNRAETDDSEPRTSRRISEGTEDEAKQISEPVTQVLTVLFSQPSADSKMIMSIPPRTKVKVLKVLSNYYKVKNGKKKGYVQKSMLKNVEKREKKEYDTKSKYMTFTTAILFRRPSPDSKVYMSIPPKKGVKIISEEGEYYKIKYKGRYGYVEKSTIKRYNHEKR